MKQVKMEDKKLSWLRNGMSRRGASSDTRRLVPGWMIASAARSPDLNSYNTYKTRHALIGWLACSI